MATPEELAREEQDLLQRLAEIHREKLLAARQERPEDEFKNLVHNPELQTSVIKAAMVLTANDPGVAVRLMHMRPAEDYDEDDSWLQESRQ